MKIILMSLIIVFSVSSAYSMERTRQQGDVVYDAVRSPEQASANKKKDRVLIKDKKPLYDSHYKNAVNADSNNKEK